MNKLENLLNCLERVKAKRDGGYMARCPVSAHNDRTASLAIKEEDGKILLKCFGSCNTRDVLESINLNMSDLFLEEGEKLEMVSIATAPRKEVEKGKKYDSIEEIKQGFKTLEDAYEYYILTDEQPTHLQVRYSIANGKSFATFHRDGDNWYSGKGDTTLTPLYNLKAVKEARAVLLVEGEKVVEILRGYGVVATCSLGGSNNSAGADFTPLVGKASVAMWPDFDGAGLIYKDDVKKILSGLNINLRCVDVEKYAKNKGDDLEQYIAELVEQGLSRDSVRGKIYSCIPKLDLVQPTDHLKKYLNKVYNGEADNLEIIGFPILSDVSQMFIPGSISLIYSNPGVGKSLLMQQIANSWTMTGTVKVKSLFLESSINTYLLRCLSRVSKRFDVLKNKFHKENPIESASIINEYEKVLDLCGSTMITSDTLQGKKITEWNETSVIDFIKKEAPLQDVLIIDPISRILGLGNSPVWEVTNRITAQVEQISSENPHCRIVFVHHPTDAEGATVSGGMGWSRFVHNQILITKEEEESLYEVITNDGDLTTVSLDRFIKIKKCRVGEGLDMKIGLKMSPEGGLGFEEVGRIIRKIK